MCMDSFSQEVHPIFSCYSCCSEGRFAKQIQLYFTFCMLEQLQKPLNKFNVIGIPVYCRQSNFISCHGIIIQFSASYAIYLGCARFRYTQSLRKLFHPTGHLVLRILNVTGPATFLKDRIPTYLKIYAL